MATDADKLLIIAGGPTAAFVQALAAMRQIRRAHPQAEISLLIPQRFAALAEACPYVDRIEPGGEPEGFGDWRTLIQRLRAARYLRVYDLECSSRTNLILQMLRPFAPKWSGVATGCALPHRNPRRMAMHPLERQAEQLKDAENWPDAPTEPHAAPPPDLSWITRRMLEPPRAQPRPHVLLAPGAAADPPDHRWPAALYAELAQRLRGLGYDILVIGGHDEGVFARVIQHRAQVRDMTGRIDLARIAALAARAALAIGNDSGLMHLVAAAGAPTLALYAKSGDPALTAPRGHVAVLQSDRLETLGVEEVLRAVERLTPPKQQSV